MLSHSINSRLTVLIYIDSDDVLKKKSKSGQVVSSATEWGDEKIGAGVTDLSVNSIQGAFLVWKFNNNVAKASDPVT